MSFFAFARGGIKASNLAMHARAPSVAGGRAGATVPELQHAPYIIADRTGHLFIAAEAFSTANACAVDVIGMGDAAMSAARARAVAGEAAAAGM